VKGAVDAVFFGTKQKRGTEGSVKAEGVRRDESRGGYREGETSESHNPMDGFGMKQGREGFGGTKRQEVEKA
jgi:hypothetical protein